MIGLGVKIDELGSEKVVGSKRRVNDAGVKLIRLTEEAVIAAVLDETAESAAVDAIEAAEVL